LIVARDTLTGWPNGPACARPASCRTSRPPLPGGQASVGRLADQLVAEQGHPVRALGPPLFFLGS